MRTVVVRCAATAAATLVLALLVVAYARFGADWPAQDFRAWVAQHGLSVWTNAWYGGSALPGYSVLYPPLAAALGSSAVGVLSATAAAALGATLAPDRRRWSAAFCAAVVLCVLECLVIGQTTFLLGVAFAALALVGLRSRRPGLAVTGAALSSLASPLAGVFLIFGGLGLLRVLGWRRVLPLAAGLLGSLVAAVVDSGGGPFTYRLVTLLAIAAFAAGTFAITDRNDRGLRDFALWYVAVSAAAFVVANPVGANLNRLGKLVALPLAVYYLATKALPRRRRVAAVLAVVLAAWWSLIPFVTAVRWGVDDPGRHLAYYRGLLGYLRGQDPTAGRLEIPFTRTHTEAYWVARSFPLARGWERQVDLGENDVLYHPLTAADYRRWLDENAVALVATSTLEPDVGGANETRLLRHPPAYLHEVWHDAHWRVWRVAGSRPLASAPASVTAQPPPATSTRTTGARSRTRPPSSAARRSATSAEPSATRRPSQRSAS